MIVTVSGEIGAGKSTVARALARALRLRYLSAGDVFREEARRRGMSLAALGRLAEQDPSIDKNLDEKQIQAARGGDILVDSRLSGWLIDGDIRIWLKAPLPVRASRVASRDSVPHDQALRDVQEREEGERRRYRKTYGIDLVDLSRYHIIVDTGMWSADDIVDVLLRLAQKFQPERLGRPF
ncbi:MAG TPA: cytidylate kinase family protein [bacterium]|nr:cytidylate kinase family protein [bacterium]